MCNSDKRHNNTVCHALRVLSQSAAIYLNQTLQLNATCNASVGAKTDVPALHCVTGNTSHKQQKSVSDIQI